MVAINYGKMQTRVALNASTDEANFLNKSERLSEINDRDIRRRWSKSNRCVKFINGEPYGCEPMVFYGGGWTRLIHCSLCGKRRPFVANDCCSGCSKYANGKRARPTPKAAILYDEGDIGKSVIYGGFRRRIIRCFNCRTINVNIADNLCSICYSRSRKVVRKLEKQHRVLEQRQCKYCEKPLSAGTQCSKCYYESRRDGGKLESFRSKVLRDPLSVFINNSRITNRKRTGQDVNPEAVKSLFTDTFLGFPSCKCAYCGYVVVPTANASFDHIDPNGGGSLDNINISCRQCNTSKRRMSECDYRDKLANDLLLRKHIECDNERRIIMFLMKYEPITLNEYTAMVQARRESR